MCGIICIVYLNNKSNRIDSQEEHLNILKNYKKSGSDWYWYGSCTCYSTKHQLLFAASIVWLEGTYVVKQPLEDDRFAFTFRGNIFGGRSNELNIQRRDTKTVFKLMHDTSKFFAILSKLVCPHAFIYFDKVEEKLYFGRARYEKESLLIGKHINGLLILTSVANTEGYDFIEVPPIGIFSLDLKTNQLLCTFKYPDLNCDSILAELKHLINKKIKKCDYYSHRYIYFTKPTSEQLHLYKEISNNGCRNVFKTLMNSPDWINRVRILESHLENAVKKRIATKPKYCKDCFVKKVRCCNHSLTGVLFSGGIDCAILALLAEKFIDEGRPIDLINVAFDESSNFQTPDRITGLQTLEELRHIRPHREWRFLKVNVTREELNSKSKNIADLIQPLKSVQDDSFGCALLFANRGKQGYIVSPSSRILLVGMGADELFGGYTRHRAALKQKGWSGLHNILIEDWQNLPYKKLDKEGKVVSDHGRQLRIPYLDKDLVHFVRRLNSWEKTYPTDDMPEGIGDKILLRCLGYYLGLKVASTLKKRTLQLGSRIARPGSRYSLWISSRMK